MQKKKLKIPSEAVYILAVALLSLAVAMISAANFGVSMIVAPAYLLSLKLEFLTFGQAEYVIQAGLFVVFCIAMRGFKIVYLSSFATCLVYGAALDLWRCIPFFDPAVTPPGSMSVPIRIMLFALGTVLTSFFSSIQTTLTRVMDPNEYDTLLTDLVASFSNVNSAILVLSVVVLALVAFAFRKELALLDVLTLGKDQAINLGVDYDRCIRRLLLGVTLYIATATAMVGPLAFLGLIIANLSRQFLRTYRHSQLITGSVLFGMAVLIGGQLLVERVFVYSVPVSVFITVGGGVYFLYLLLTQRKA